VETYANIIGKVNKLKLCYIPVFCDPLRKVFLANRIDFEKSGYLRGMVMLEKKKLNCEKCNSDLDYENSTSCGRAISITCPNCHEINVVCINCLMAIGKPLFFSSSTTISSYVYAGTYYHSFINNGKGAIYICDNCYEKERKRILKTGGYGCFVSIGLVLINLLLWILHIISFGLMFFIIIGVLIVGNFSIYLITGSGFTGLDEDAIKSAITKRLIKKWFPKDSKTSYRV
jgi:hypothetical protein